MTQTPTAITISGGLLTASFIDNIREPGARWAHFRVWGSPYGVLDLDGNAWEWGRTSVK